LLFIIFTDQLSMNQLYLSCDADVMIIIN
jgi:hypothetical protein